MKFSEAMLCYDWYFDVQYSNSDASRSKNVFKESLLHPGKKREHNFKKKLFQNSKTGSEQAKNPERFQDV